MGRLKLTNPVVMFRLLLVVVVVVVVTAIGVTWRVTATADSASRDASARAELALLAAEASDQFRVMAQAAQDRIDAVLASPQAAELIATEQQAVDTWLTGESQTPPSDEIANLAAALSLTEAVEFQRSSSYLEERTNLLLRGVDDPVVKAAQEQFSNDIKSKIATYFQEPTLAHLRDVSLSLRLTRLFVSGQVAGLSEEAMVLRDQVSADIVVLRWAIVALGIVGAVLVLSLAFLISRATQRLLRDARREHDQLAHTTEDLEYRNAQLSALYNVFNEITDTLSLRYVVRAALSESLRIMSADMAVLRVLRGDELEVLGAMTAGEQEVQGLPPVKLGEGPAGRTAKRGRTLSIDQGGERLMAPPDAQEDDPIRPSLQSGMGGPLESGLIVPLIVGARVVGTISCWSRRPHAFSASDERVLEMMASQVATAIVAADSTEKSESQAMHDPLTSLPNRRQLDEDIAGRLSAIARDGNHAVIAMIDIDHFKHLNDEYGHRVGDVTLQKVAAVLRSSAREDDLVYRYGGEEFVVVFTDTRPEDAVSLADRLRLAVEAAPLSGEHLDPVGPVTVSIGLALMPEHGVDMYALISMADKAMYLAKNNGRNRVELWDGREDAGNLTEVA